MATPQVLVYNEDKSYEQQFSGKEAAQIIELMGEEVKIFFHAKLTNKMLHIEDFADWQKW